MLHLLGSVSLAWHRKGATTRTVIGEKRRSQRGSAACDAQPRGWAAAHAAEMAGGPQGAVVREQAVKGVA